jgi:hypothetical protein
LPPSPSISSSPGVPAISSGPSLGAPTGGSSAGGSSVGGVDESGVAWKMFAGSPVSPVLRATISAKVWSLIWSRKSASSS